MFKRLSLVVFVVAAVGCKSNGNSSSAAAQGSAAASGEQNRAGNIRSGKANFRPMRNGNIGQLATGAMDMTDSGDDEGSDREARRAARMAKMDTDGDGQISQAERDKARKDRQLEIEAKLDTNKDGTVSPEERAAAQHERAETLRTKLDTDGDGRLTLAEMQNSRFAQLDPNALDANKDGVISTDELQAGLPTRPRFMNGGMNGGMHGMNAMGSGAPAGGSGQ